MKTPCRSIEAGNSLVETMAATLIVATFFVSIFEVNGMCLRYINASKENIAAVECVQDRLEQLRNLDFSTLVDATAMTTLITDPPNSSSLPLKATETVTVRSFVNGAPVNNPSIIYTRGAGSSVTPSQSAVGSFTGITIVQLDVAYSWTTTFGGRARIERTSSIVSAGTKK